MIKKTTPEKAIKKIFPLVSLACLLAVTLPACAGDLRISWPKHSKPTPVQALNQDGVNAIKKHDLEKAERLFYKAYLLDPDDPFTLNNLGYISEIQGKVQRAEKYYKLAAQQNSEAVVQTASVPDVKGKELSQVAGGYASQDLRVNRGNVEAMSLLAQGRAQEAEDVLRKTLDYDPQNAFTLNNLGSVMEAEGNLQGAIHYYDEAALRHSSELIVVTENRQLAGKPISEVAASNALAVQKRLNSTEENVEAEVARLNLQGVSALNHNDSGSARRFFEQAYKLDPLQRIHAEQHGIRLRDERRPGDCPAVL